MNALPIQAAEASSERRWKDLTPATPPVRGPAYAQGYGLARKVRKDLGLGTDPIQRMDVLLSQVGVRDMEAPSFGLFRSASCIRERTATIVVSRDIFGVVPRRVALAASFGRLLFEGRGKAWGAAVGENSRWEETRRANAFAAELLAPASVVPKYADAPERLAEDYGISVASARWRIYDVLNAH